MSVGMDQMMAGKGLANFALHQKVVLTLLMMALTVGRGAVLRCDSHNRDPCTKFPSLCTEGGGLCVIKGPCEYECVCPPDGRRGRDCSRNGAAPNQPNESGAQPNNDAGSLVESLLVFPKNLFWDSNHLDKPLELDRFTTRRPPATGDVPEAAVPTLTQTSAGAAAAAKVSPGNGESPSAKNVNAKQQNAKPGVSSPTTTTTTTTTTATIVMKEVPPSATSASRDGTPNTGMSEITTPNLPQSPPASVLNSDKPISKTDTNTDLTIPQQAQMPETTSTQPVLTDMSATSTFTITVPKTRDLNPVSSNAHTPEASSTSAPSEETSSGKPSDLAPPQEVGTPTESQSHSQMADQSVNESRSRFRETFPGHEAFPTFFSGGLHQDAPTESNEKTNAAVSFVVQRVFHAPEPFPVFRRNNGLRIRRRQ